MALSLGLHTVTGVDQDDRQITGRSTGRHVTGVLLMAGGIGDDELALGSREVAVGNVDGNTLLTLGLQAIHQQRQIHLFASGAGLLGVTGDGFHVIFIDHLGVMQQTPDQGALAVIDVTAGQKAQQFLAFVLGQVSQDVLANQIGLVRHSLFSTL